MMPNMVIPAIRGYKELELALESPQETLFLLERASDRGDGPPNREEAVCGGSIDERIGSLELAASMTDISDRTNAMA